MASADGNAQPPKEDVSVPARCAAGCGFFGNPSTGGMCSKCFKESLAKAAAATPPAPAAPTPPPAAVSAPSPPPAAAAATPEPQPAAAPAAEPAAVDVSEPAAAATPAAPAAAAATPKPAEQETAASSSSPVVAGAVRAPEDAPPEDEPPKKVQANTSRCWTCNRKIGLLGFQCKCEYFFCAEHRYSDRHECSFDFKAQGKQLLQKANPTIAPSKLESM